MPKASRSEAVSSKGRAVQPKKARARAVASKPPQVTRAAAEPTQTVSVQSGWATDLVFDVREPKLAVSLRLDADVLRFFRGFGAGYQTRINEVLKAFMQARGGSQPMGRPMVGARASRATASEGKRTR